MTDEEIIFNSIVDKLTDILPALEPNSVSREHSLHDLGANSIDRADIITSIIYEQKVDISLTSFISCKNIGDIITVVANAKQK